MNGKLTTDDKKYIYDLLADLFIASLNQRFLGRFERKILARRVVDAVDKSKSWGEIISFVSEFSKKYPFCQPAIGVFQAKTNEGKEQAVIDKLENYFKSYQKSN